MSDRIDLSFGDYAEIDDRGVCRIAVATRNVHTIQGLLDWLAPTVGGMHETEPAEDSVSLDDIGAAIRLLVEVMARWPDDSRGGTLQAIGRHVDSLERLAKALQPNAAEESPAA